MAGMRIGYAIGHRDLIGGMNKIRNQFEVTRLSQMAALASLSDPEHVDRVIAAVQEGQRDYRAIAEKHGFIALPSATNFVAIDVGNGDRARTILRNWARKGCSSGCRARPDWNRCIRVTVGTPDERAVFATALEKVVAELGGL